MIAKLKIVEEESDESLFWLECLFVARLPTIFHPEARALEDQFTQFTKMTVAAIRTSRARLSDEHLRPRQR